MSDLISREEVIKRIESRNERLMHDEEYRKKRGDIDLLGVIPSIHNIPSADIMECARAIKEYCEKHECERCDFAEHRVLRNTDNYICRVHYACPCGWNLPEGEKE